MEVNIEKLRCINFRIYELFTTHDYRSIVFSSHLFSRCKGAPCIHPYRSYINRLHHYILYSELNFNSLLCNRDEYIYIFFSFYKRFNYSNKHAFINDINEDRFEFMIFLFYISLTFFRKLSLLSSFLISIRNIATQHAFKSNNTGHFLYIVMHVWDFFFNALPDFYRISFACSVYYYTASVTSFVHVPSSTLFPLSDHT